MAERLVEDEAGRELLVAFIRDQELPFTCNVTQGRHRSTEQNRLQRLWVNEVSIETGHEPEEIRGFCKLHFGVPILREENEEFRKQYDRILKGLSYDAKLAIMMMPLDLPVTRLMTVKQKKQYLDTMYHFYTEKGYILTDPEKV